MYVIYAVLYPSTYLQCIKNNKIITSLTKQRNVSIGHIFSAKVKKGRNPKWHNE